MPDYGDPGRLAKATDAAIARDNAQPREPHPLCGRIKPGDQRVGAACGLAEGHVQRAGTDHANARGDTWPEPKRRGPYVGPRGEASEALTPPQGWTADELMRAQEHVNDLLQRELEHAHHLASVPMHGAPAGRTQGYYAARAYLLACHLYPQRVVMGLPDELVHNHDGGHGPGCPTTCPANLQPAGIVTLPERQPVLHYCPGCGTRGTEPHEQGSEDCYLLVMERAYKNRDD